MDVNIYEVRSFKAASRGENTNYILNHHVLENVQMLQKQWSYGTEHYVIFYKQ